MKKLIQVVRGIPERGTSITVVDADGEPLRVRNHVQVVMPRGLLSIDHSNFTRDGEFFYVDEKDADLVMMCLARSNPGCEVRVYGVEQIAQSPAADPVVKKVDKHGVLPATTPAKTEKTRAFMPEAAAGGVDGPADLAGAAGRWMAVEAPIDGIDAQANRVADRF